MSKIESVQPVLMSRDVGRSIQFYAKLGFALLGQDNDADPRYARLGRDNIEIHIQQHDPVEWTHPSDRPSYRFLVDDIDSMYTDLSSAGGLADATAILDTAWGTREFHVRDPDLNVLQFYRST